MSQPVSVPIYTLCPGFTPYVNPCPYPGFIPSLLEYFAYYADIMLDALACLLCLICWHNRRKPTHYYYNDVLTSVP